MPKIPTYTGGVQDESIRAPRLPTEVGADTFGGGPAVANAIGAAQNNFQAIQQQATDEYKKQYYDTVQQQAMEMSSKITKEETRLKSDFMNLSGPDAIKATNEINGNLQKYYQDLEKNIQNDDVRKLVNRHYLGTQDQLGAWSQHVAGVKMRQYDQEQFTSEGQILLDSVSVDPSMQNVATAAVGRKRAIELFGQRNGMSPEWIKAQQEQQGSAIHLAALKALVPMGDLAAKNFYDNNKADFVGHDAVVAANLVEDNTYRGQAQRDTERIFTAYAGDEQKALDEARKIEDPKLQDMVVARVKSRFEDVKRIRIEQDRQNFADAADFIEANTTKDTFPADVLSKMDPEMYGQLTLGQKAQLERRIKQIKDGLGPQALSDKYLSYVRESAVDPDTFVKRNFAAMRDEITAHEAQELTKDQASIIKGDERMALKKAGFLTLEKIASLRLKTLGVVDDDDKEEFMNALNRDFYTWKADPKNKGANLSPEEASKMVSQLLAEKKRWWWTNTYEIRKIKDVPAGDRAAIEKQLKEAGETPTEGRIVEIYNAGK